MVSSLVAQLAQSASLNSALLVDRSRRKSGESYLFTGREADQHDLESIHALGVNGLLHLASLSSALRPFEESLFSDASKGMDRTLLSAEANVQLDKTIAAFLFLLGPYLMEIPTGKVLEWLVRRFRINEFNVENVLALFLPYHESPHFAKMLTILYIKENSTWSFLLAFKSAAQCVPRVSLVTEMLRNSDLARFVTSLLPSAIKGGYSHRALLAFNAASLHDFIVHSKVLDEGTVAYLLPALLEPLQQGSNPTPKDAILGSYILVVALSQKCHITQDALKTVVGAMANCARRVATKQFVSAVVSVCEPQDELESFSDATVKAVLRQSNINDELRKALVWIGIEKFICPLLSAVGRRMWEDNASTFLDSIIASPNVPTIVVRRSSTMLINQSISLQGSTPDVLAIRRILSSIQQRHPSTLHEVIDEISQSDNASKDLVEQLIISLSMNYATQGLNSSGLSSDEVDMTIASTSADAKLRVIAVKHLIDSLSGQQALDPSDVQSMSSALLARVLDTNPQVLEALYHKPSVIVPILSKDWRTYIDSLVHALCTVNAKPKRLVLRIHLTFLVLHFCRTTNPSVLAEVFHRIFFPFLLFSKPRQRTAVAVWEVISQGLNGSDGVDTFELLRGCADGCKWENGMDGMDPVEKMSSINTEIASKMAENVLVSNNYSDHLDALLSKLRDCNPHVRVLGYLITRALLVRLSGEHQIDAAHKVLEVMRLEQLASIEDFPHGADKLKDVLTDVSLGKDAVLKPSSKNITRRLQISIVALVPAIPRPTGIALDWLTDLPSDSSDRRGRRYVWLMQAIYKLTNSSTSLPLLTTNLLRALFVNLKEDALAFLAGIWIGSDEIMGENEQLCVVALRHAVAFLEAHLPEDEGVDFQTILPSLIVVLQGPNVQRRQAALECISLLSKLAQRRFSTVYGFDAIYGANSGKLQYLNQDDFRQYIGALAEHQDHLAQDPSYIKVFHQQHLGMTEPAEKRDSDYKRHVLCYLLSHVNALCLPTAQIALLKSIEDVSNKAKALVLLPTFDSLIEDRSSSGVANHYDQCLEEFASLVVSSFDASVSNDLNDQNGPLWNVFISTLRYYFTSGHMLTPRIILTRTLEHDLFVSLKLEHKIEVCELLLKMGAQDPAAYAYCKNVLSNLLQEGPLMVHLLNSLQPTQSADDPPAKRAKLTVVPEDRLPSLSLLAEVLGTKPLPGSFDLISHLLETLSKVVQSVSPTQADISYIEQLLMSAVENSATNILELPNLTPSAIRLDILVELIRVADNPQTFHQALLLMASLARLAPDSVLHNVMPVFTFMGSNVFHRDDTYSFRVVQKTIDSIVPVMVLSLKRAHSHRLDLYIGSRDFLRIFTDAANHIPRHRRTNFFAHLVDVLGSDDFLAPVCMLLIEKVANRVVRQNVADVQGSLALPISILQHYPPSLQNFILTELLRESERLAARVVEPETSQPTFLEGSQCAQPFDYFAITSLPDFMCNSDDEHSLPSSAIFKRRAQAIVTFVGYALKSSSPAVPVGVVPEGGAMSDLVSLLITMATLQGGTVAENNVDDIRKAARLSMSRALVVMSAVDFISAVRSMLESGEQRVQAGALDLLSDRLEGVSEKIRHEITPTVNKIIESIRTLIALHPDGPLTVAAFRALRTIGLTTCPGEESSLMNILPLVITAIRGRKMAPSAVAALPPLARKLGPRVIPYFREIITESVSLLREGVEGAIVDDTLGVLHGLLTSIPTFWGVGEITQVVKLYLDHYASMSSTPSSAMPTLMKAIAKRAPTKVLVPAIYEMWPSLKTSLQMGNTDCFVAYFDLLKRVLRSAARPVVLEHLRPLFKVFLEAFEEFKVRTDEAEAQGISAFIELVVKLNEAAFRPLFRRLYDWAFANEAADNLRKITFCHVYIGLLDFFKELMNPYMSLLLQPFVDSLKVFSKSGSDEALWACTIETLTKSLNFDDGAFWRDDKLRLITPQLIEQVAVCIRLNSADGKTMLLACLVALADCATNDAILKSINLDLLMHTRSDDARLCLFALTCSEALWRAHGGKLIGFVAETTTFIAECVEDENENVVQEARKLKDAVENVAGNISGL